MYSVRHYSAVFRTGRVSGGGVSVCVWGGRKRGAGRGARGAGRGTRGGGVGHQAYRVCKPIYRCEMSGYKRVFMNRYVFSNALSSKALFRSSLYMFIRRHPVGYTIDFCMSSAGT